VEEPHTARVLEQDVSFIVRRSPRRRSIELQVDENGLTVHAPWRASRRRILDALQAHGEWVARKLQAWQAAASRRRQWVHGATVPFLGRELSLEVTREARTRVQLLDDDRLRVGIVGPPITLHQSEPDTVSADPTSIRDAVVAWYRRHAPPLFHSSVTRYAPLLQVTPPRIFISNARGRWGSCNSRAQIRLNWRLVQAKQAIIDYVVVHELAHLREMNHSRRFWSLVESIYPDYLTARAELDRLGGELMAL
jgi:predicted metal-dependent hydrolase